MPPASRSVGQHLVDRGTISADQLAWAEARQSGQPGGVPGVLLGAGLVTEAQLVAAAAERLDVPFVDLENRRVDAELARRLSPDTARAVRAIPISEDATGMTVAMADPMNADAVAKVGGEVGRPVRAVAAVPSVIDRLLASLERVGPPARPREADARGRPGLDALLAEVLRRRGSDLHLSIGRPPGVRVHGDIASLADQPVLTAARVEELVFSALSEEKRRRFDEDLELDTSYTAEGMGRFRVNVFMQRGAIGAVLRSIPFEIPEFASLELPPSVADLANLHRGLVLVTGPTGSGKSTTLASLIDIVNRSRRAHIMTVEDPIEFVHQHKESVVNQREVGQDTHSFGAALKHVLRQDPDVILVGEMRDLETIATALTAAETGHLVFGTLHTQSAPQSVDRIIDVFPAHQQQQIRTQLATTMRGVVTQQLVPAIGGGRVVAAEVLIATNAVRALIRDGKTHQITSAMQSGGKTGMQTMDHCLARLVRDGRVSMDVALDRCHDEDDLRRLAGVGGAGNPMPTGSLTASGRR